LEDQQDLPVQLILEVEQGEDLVEALILAEPVRGQMLYLLLDQ
jgi:hypothetical protein